MSAYTTIPAAYAETGVSEALIKSAIQDGTIHAFNCAGEVVVVLEDVRNYRARLLAGRAEDDE